MEKLPWVTSKGQIPQIVVPIITLLAGAAVQSAVTAMTQKAMGASLEWWGIGVTFVVAFLVMWWVSRITSKVGKSSSEQIPLVKVKSDLPVDFGSPVQRAKEDQENESFWHIPVTLRPDPENKGRDVIPGCEFYLTEYGPQGAIKNQMPLMIGDAALDVEFVKQRDLVRGKTYLVPVAWRFEQDKTKQGYITDTRFFRKAREFRYPLEPDRRKHRYRLSVMSGETEHFSPHFYLLRVPKSYTNGHFVLEVEYEGKGSQ